MNVEYFLNHFSNNEIFYKKIGEFKVKEPYLNCITEHLHTDFMVSESSIYTNIINKNIVLPVQGWKIHISSNIFNAEEILKIVSSLFEKFNFSFKFIKSEYFLLLTTEKFYPREQAGKFVTIYPNDEVEFRKIIASLYDSLRDFDGPFVLTDKRYKDCKVLYYRYGAFLSMTDKLSSSASTLSIISPSGELVEDSRDVQYVLPHFVEEVFPDIVLEEDGDSHLFSHYLDIEPLKFTNHGGVYVAKYQGKQVVLKESRPCAGVSKEDNLDAIKRRINEVNFLKVVQDLSCFPKLVDDFFEWEHYFLVEEYVEGVTLRGFSASHNPFFSNSHTDYYVVVANYIKEVITIVKQVLEAITIVHSRGYIISDISLENIIKTELGIVFIDLESVFDVSTPPKNKLTTIQFTQQPSKVESIDYIATGFLLYDLIFPKSIMLDFGLEYLMTYLTHLIEDFGLNREILNVINLLLTFDQHDDLQTVYNLMNQILEKPLEVFAFAEKSYNLQQVIDEQKNNILGFLDSASLLDQKYFPHSLSKIEWLTGLSGILYYFQKQDGKNLGFRKLEEQIIFQFMQSNIKESLGLFYGASGVALSMLTYRPAFAKNIFNFLSHRHNIKDKIDFSISEGLSGYGLALLKAWEIQQEDDYLKRAVQIGEYLIESEDIINSCENIGFAHGLTGVAYFLLVLYKVTNREQFLNYGESLLQKDFNYLIDLGLYMGFPDKKTSNISYPYLAFGSAGVASVLIRYYLVTQKATYLEKIDMLLDSLNVKYALSNGLLKGLAGIGHALLDYLYYISNSEIMDSINSVSEGILLNKISQSDYIYFPDCHMEKLDYSLEGGNLGILSFFERQTSFSYHPMLFCDSLLGLERINYDD